MAMALVLPMPLAMAIANGGGEPRLVAPPGGADHEDVESGPALGCGTKEAGAQDQRLA
jgi:hypothetical protein